MSIIVTDTVNNLQVYHYDDNTTDPEPMNIRGIIKDGETVIVKTFGYTPEVLANDLEQLNNIITPLVNGDTRFFKSYEGTLLRVWNYEGKWYLSTHRKIDANTSKWGHNQTYGQLFARALHPIVAATLQPEQTPFEAFTQMLNPDKIYVFLLRSFSENRKVCMGGSEPILYTVGSFVRSENFKFCSQNLETLASTPEEIMIESADALIETVLSLDPKEYQGIVCMNPDGQSAKVVSPAYDRLDKLRGNVPNVVHRYVQLRWDQAKIKEYCELYPEHQEKFQEWEKVMSHIVSNIMRKYIERYINHNIALLPAEQYAVLQELDTLYHTVLKQQGKRVTPDDIWAVLGTWQERKVNELYKAYKHRERVYGNGNKLPDSVRERLMNKLR